MIKIEPQLSVIIPVHNTAPYLKRCVDSVVNQTMKNIEIILVENLSIDSSGSICDEYALQDQRIKVMHLDKAGLSIARNAGISVASAPYVGFIDSDDWILPNMYEDLWKTITTNGSEIAYCNLCYEHVDGKIEHIYPNSGKIYERRPKDVIFDIFCENVSSSCCTKLFKKELFLDLRFPEGLFFEDHCTFYKWVEMCTKVSWIDKTYYYYYQREGSICHSTDLNRKFDYFMAEYGRLNFVCESSLFDKIEQDKLIKVIIKHALAIFKMFMIEPTHYKYKSKILLMRRALKKCLNFSKKQIGQKNYKRLIKITYFWPLYYLIRYNKYHE